MRYMFEKMLEPVSDETRARLLRILQIEGSIQAQAEPTDVEIVHGDNLLLHLSEHIHMLQNCPPQKRDTLLSGMLDIYALQRPPGMPRPLIISLSTNVDKLRCPCRFQNKNFLHVFASVRNAFLASIKL
jgi:hypothetical protein